VAPGRVVVKNNEVVAVAVFVMVDRTVVLKLVVTVAVMLLVSVIVTLLIMVVPGCVIVVGTTLVVTEMIVVGLITVTRRVKVAVVNDTWVVVLVYFSVRVLRDVTFVVKVEIEVSVTVFVTG